jgi:hypothetical protein
MWRNGAVPSRGRTLWLAVIRGVLGRQLRLRHAPPQIQERPRLAPFLRVGLIGHAVGQRRSGRQSGPRPEPNPLVRLQ